MLICHCQRVNDRRIRQALVDGARTVGQVGRLCGAGTQCGGCVPAVVQLVEEARNLGPAGARDLPLAAE